MATTLSSVLGLLSETLSTVARTDGSFWGPTTGDEIEGSLDAANRDGRFLFDLTTEKARVSVWTGFPGIAVWEQRAILNLYSEPTGDLLDAQVAAIDDARAVTAAVEAFSADGVEFCGVEEVDLDVDGTSVVARLVVLLRYQVSVAA